MKQRLLYTLALLLATTQTFAQSSKTTYEYDSNNRLTKIAYSNGVSVVYTYDELGNRLSKKVTGAVQKKEGDVNGDGKLNAKDIIDLVDYMLGKNTISFSAADVNGDGKVNIADVIIVSNAVLKQD